MYITIHTNVDEKKFPPSRIYTKNHTPYFCFVWKVTAFSFLGRTYNVFNLSKNRVINWRPGFKWA